MRILPISFLFTILMAVTTYASSTAVVTGSRVNVRSSAEISTDNVLFQANNGEIVEVFGIDGDFFHVTISGTNNVFISSEFVRFIKTEGMVTEPFAWVNSNPGEEDDIAMLVYGEIITVVSVYEEWYFIEIDNLTGYVYKSAVDIPYYATLPTSRIGNTLADEIIETAMDLLGSRYLAGGASPRGFDCSGFTSYVFSQHGINLQRSSRYQVNNGYAVEINELERGDLVFFGYGGNINHVGLYIGNGQFIHSSTESTGVIISTMESRYNKRNYITARRVL